MNYKARMGMLAGGAYGLPQFCMRVFLWGALQGEKLSKFPLPTHKVDSRGIISKEFECNNAEYENHDVNLKDTLFLEDAISDLPKVENTELNEDDFQRVCHVPKRKGANFRDLLGVRVVGNKVELDPNVERVAEPQNQAICHPVQDRVLTIRENARLQEFPDYYKLCGSIKDKYTQVGNAVVVLVAKALGYSLALSFKGLSEAAAMFTLTEGYGAIQELPANQTSPAEFP
ncbi:unnamed protein product [Cuscuta campestris]|uniref:DNA (cytosine-5-)-methyltransferase n=1 Tax=Cuscuta campestris TaxID=132261 RepID=A0A484LU55_9ASTE|nr:unnamed protein product [Cuscuta campestris]